MSPYLSTVETSHLNGVHSSSSDAGLVAHATGRRRVARRLAHLVHHVVRVDIRSFETTLHLATTVCVQRNQVHLRGGDRKP